MASNHCFMCLMGKKDISRYVKEHSACEIAITFLKKITRNVENKAYLAGLLLWM